MLKNQTNDANPIKNKQKGKIMPKMSLGDRMKMYEAQSEDSLMEHLPIVVRLDGRSFSNFCRGMEKPFDSNFRQAMIEATKKITKETNAVIGYTQSDEISLILSLPNEKSSMPFKARVQKSVSVWASLLSVEFFCEMLKRFPEKDLLNAEKKPHFDCRMFNVPNKTEAYNALLWRENDCTKNSISMVGQNEFSHKELQGLNGKQIQYKLITEKGINWNDFDPIYKRGAYVQRRVEMVKLEQEALDKIPEDKRPEGGLVPRNKMVVLEMPRISEVKNIFDVIFEKEDPIY